LAKWFAIEPAFGFGLDIFPDIDKGIIALTEDVLQAAFGE
jgi:hypothetical protein